MQSKLLKIVGSDDERVVIATRVSIADSEALSEELLLNEAGYGDGSMLYLIDLATHKIQFSSFVGDDKLLRNAHLVISQQWPILKSGNIINIQSGSI